MIDTHQHLIYPSRFCYSWTADLPALQGDFRIEEYRTASGDSEIEGTLFMEVDVDADQCGKEAAFFYQLAEDAANGILGVVAAARPEHTDFENYLDSISHPKLRGIRRVLHTQPDELSKSRIFRNHIASLAVRKLTFDLCVLERQLPLAIELVDACLDTQFILDHCGVPDIAANSPDFWRSQISELAKRPNIACKVSGLLLYAGDSQRSASGVLPWFAHVVESFGWDRIVWGGDWPVCTLAVPLSTWVVVTNDLLDLVSASPGQRRGLLTANAKRIYHL